jgi:hypothetical protein
MQHKSLNYLLREVVRLRAKDKCEYPLCFCREGDPHHWFSRANHATRYDFEGNLLWLCSEHHTTGSLSAHKSPQAFKKEIIDKGIRSQAWVDKAALNAKQVVKVNKEYKTKWRKLLTDELERLNGKMGEKIH